MSTFIYTHLYIIEALCICIEDDGALCIEADTYCKGGADAKQSLCVVSSQAEQLDLARSFCIKLSLTGLWWSPSTYSLRRQASECCEQVLAGLVELKGFSCFSGDMDLSHNDLDDQFVQRLCRMLETTSSSVHCLVLRENRITTQGALDMVEHLRSADRTLAEQMKLENNPVDKATAVKCKARTSCPTIRFSVEPVWSIVKGEKALATRSAWWVYFSGLLS